MTLYENVATSSLINMFESPQRSYYKTKVVYDFLLSKNDYKFEDIESVEEQKKGKETIPDFSITLTNSKKITFEVKINKAPLTNKEKEPGNRDVFLLPYNYPHKEEIEELSSSPKILYWEDLFDLLDKQNIEIDGLDKVRNVIEYPKVKLKERILEVFLNLITRYPKINIDLENSKFDEKKINVALIAGESENAQVTITNEYDKVAQEEKLYIERDGKKEIMSIKKLKRTKKVTEIAQIIYEALYNNLPTEVIDDWDVPTNTIYEKVVNDLDKKYCDKKDKDNRGHYSLSPDHYAYLDWYHDSRKGDVFEIGFGVYNGYMFTKNDRTALTEVYKRAQKIIRPIKKKGKDFNYTFHEKEWVGFRLFIIDNGKNNNEDGICEIIEDAMDIMITRGTL